MLSSKSLPHLQCKSFQGCRKTERQVRFYCLLFPITPATIRLIPQNAVPYITHSRNDPYPHAGLFSKSTIAQNHPYSNNNSGNAEQKLIQEKRFSHQQLLPQPSQISILYDIKDNNQQHQPEGSCRWRIIRSSQHDGCPSNQKHDKLNCSRLFSNSFVHCFP